MRKTISDDMTVGDAMDLGALVPNPFIKWSGKGALGRVKFDVERQTTQHAREVVEIIGVGLFALLRKSLRRRTQFGYLSIPRTMKRDHWIRAAIGDSAADALQSAVRDRTIDGNLDIRGRQIAMRAERDDWLRYRFQLGESVADLAREFEMSDRMVRNVVSDVAVMV